MPTDHPLEDVLEQAIEDAERHDEKASLGDLLEFYDDRSFGPVLAILGLVAVLPPMGAIPGVPAAVGVVILLFSIQMVFGRRHVWLPGMIRNLSISKEKLQAAHDKSEGALKRVDGLVTDRLEWAVSGPARYAAAVLASVLALALIPLELVPFAVAAPGLAITMIGLALLARDGALMLLAYALSAAAAVILVLTAPGLGG